MLKEYYLENVYQKFDLNCAESVLFTADKVYCLLLPADALHLSSAFGGGMFIEEKCGAVTGSLMVLGYIFVKDNAHSTDYLKEIVKTFFIEFENLMGSCECSPLKEKHRSKTSGCQSVIASALDILEKTVNIFCDKKVR